MEVNSWEWIRNPSIIIKYNTLYKYKKYESATFKTPMTASARLFWSSGLMFIYCLLMRNIAYVSGIKQWVLVFIR